MFSQNAYVKGTMTKDEEIKVEAKYHWIKWLWFYFMFATLGVVALVSFRLLSPLISTNRRIWPRRF